MFMLRPVTSGCALSDFLLSMSHFAGSLFAAARGAAILAGLFDRFAGFAGALLNPANKFFLLAFGVLEIVIREPEDSDRRSL